MLERQTRLRILIADDIADVRHDLRLLLEIAGDVEVVAETADGQEAVDRSAVLRPDVVIMDLAMPGLDGCQAASRIKSQHTGSRVVALTVHQDPASRQKALAAGFDAFVVKGAPMMELLGAIGSLGASELQEIGGLS
jgi:DNA-binding NarL/FixJ family response regulator